MFKDFMGHPFSQVHIHKHVSNILHSYMFVLKIKLAMSQKTTKTEHLLPLALI